LTITRDKYRAIATKEKAEKKIKDSIKRVKRNIEKRANYKKNTKVLSIAK